MKAASSLVVAVFSALTFAVPAAHALDAASERIERDRIKAEREQAEAAFMTREHECRQRFVVTPCLDGARRDRRQTLERLRQQQEVLDEAQRKQRAAQRIDDIRTKVSGDDAKQREAIARQRRKEAQQAEFNARLAEQAASAASAPPAQEAPASAAVASQALPARDVPSSDRTKNVADYERRQQEAQAHKQAVERRNAERARSTKTPVKGLPIPTPAGSAPPAH